MGFDVLVKRMKDGKQVCKEFEDFLKARYIFLSRRQKCLLLPPANEVWGKVIFFRSVCQEFCSQDQVHPLWHQVPPRTRYPPPPPDQVHSPGTRYTPRDQVHPPGPGTPPWTRYTPPDQVHPPGAVRYGKQAGGTHPTGMHSC